MQISLDTFLISDTHFGQKSVISREKIRSQIAAHLGYKNHFDLLVDNWNARISRGDLVLHLGDVYFGNGLKYIKKLNGKKRLIIGNNDIKRFEKLRALGWMAKNKVILQIPQKKFIRQKIAQKYKNIEGKIYLNALVCDVAGERIMFSHFPVFDRKKKDRFCAVRDVLDDYYRFCECSLNIHGHTHSRITSQRFCVNLSCEQTLLAPLTLKEAIKMAK
ncbi:metallophosphoesterase family protein [Helicobacter sp. 23-1045]